MAKYGSGYHPTKIPPKKHYLSIHHSSVYDYERIVLVEEQLFNLYWHEVSLSQQRSIPCSCSKRFGFYCI